MTLSTRRRSSIPRYSSREADFDEIALQFSFALLGFVKGSSVLRAYTLFIRDMRRRGRLVTVHRAETILSRGWRCFSLYCQVFYLLRVSASWEKKNESEPRSRACNVAILRIVFSSKFFISFRHVSTAYPSTCACAATSYRLLFHTDIQTFPLE